MNDHENNGTTSLYLSGLCTERGYQPVNGGAESAATVAILRALPWPAAGFPPGSACVIRRPGTAANRAGGG